MPLVWYHAALWVDSKICRSVCHTEVCCWVQKWHPFILQTASDQTTLSYQGWDWGRSEHFSGQTDIIQISRSWMPFHLPASDRKLWNKVGWNKKCFKTTDKKDLIHRKNIDIFPGPRKLYLNFMYPDQCLWIHTQIQQIRENCVCAQTCLLFLIPPFPIFPPALLELTRLALTLPKWMY